MKSIIKDRDTVGTLSSRLLERELKNPSQHSATDQMREQLKDYDYNIHLCIKDNKKKYVGNFYVIVLIKKEKLMQNVLRAYFLARETCPTPQHDQVVYLYNCREDKIDFLWVVPNADTASYMKCNPHIVLPRDYELLRYVVEFYDGSLLRKAKELNGEKRNSSFLEI